MGGGGFSLLNPTPCLNKWFLSLANAARPRLGYLPTACGDNQERIDGFLQAAGSLPCTPVVLSVFRPEEPDLAGLARSCDLVWVGGGNTYNMLHLWRAWGLVDALRWLYEQGAPLGGVSAGANCWFEQCSTDSFGGHLDVMECLGWVEGSYCPHYDSEENRRPTLKRFMEEGRLKPGWACDEQVGLLLLNEQPVKAVAENGVGAAYRVGLAGGLFAEETVEPERLS